MLDTIKNMSTRAKAIAFGVLLVIIAVVFLFFWQPFDASEKVGVGSAVVGAIFLAAGMFFMD